MMDSLINIWLTVFSLASIWLVSSTSHARVKYASVCGLLAQPTWLYLTWQSKEWSLFLIACVYTASWARAFYRDWLSHVEA